MSPSPEPPSPAAPATRYRWTICALLFCATTANYIDRGLFGNLAPELQKEVGWTQADYWNMQVAFSAAYALSLALSGRMIDALGLRRGYAIAVALWGLAAVSHAFVGTVAGFFALRILLGLGQGGNFPAAIKTVAEWFPKRERAFATGLFNSGSNAGAILVPFGVAALVPLLAGVSLGGHVLGTRGAFLVSGVIDLAWIGTWLVLYRAPEEHPRVSAAELAHIRNEPPEPTVKIPWRRLLGLRQTWAFAFAKFMTDCFWWFYLVGAPYFFADRFALNLKARSLPVACIYLVAAVASISGGWLSGKFISRGWTINKARKITLLLCALAVAPVAFASVTHQAWVAVALIALAASAHSAWSANVFNLTSDMFPRRVVGSVTGLGGMAGALGGIVLFVIVGKIREAAIARGEIGNYVPIFMAASVSYLLALLVVHLLVPKLEPAQLEADAAPRGLQTPMAT